MKYASIILDDNINKNLSYSIPKNLLSEIKPGMRVAVPVKNNIRKGLVLELIPQVNIKNIKEIKEIISPPLLSKDLLKLALWMSKYYCCSLSKIFKCIIPSSIKKEIKPKHQVFLSLNKSKKEILQTLPSLSKNQAQIIELFLKTKKGFFLSDLIKIINSSKSPINSLIEKKLLKQKKISHDISKYLDYFKTSNKPLNSEQKQAFDKIINSLEKNTFQTHLLHGVTGSGKTEVFLQAIQKALELNKSSIMLVPEIALTSQTIERFKSRFEEKIEILHYRRSLGERYEAWHKILKKEIKIVIGARSAIFSPLKNLGLIIVDEEHDNSYKSEEMPTYHARNIAVMRGKIASSTVVLASATPSIESYYNSLNKKYLLSTLNKRANNAHLPKVHIVDMKTEFIKNKGFTHFSDILLKKIKMRYSLGEQVILFLNRRGYNNFLICTECRKVVKCIHCDLSLTFHKTKNILSCHSCNYSIDPPRTCSCSSSYLKYKGFGTEHVEASLKAIYPEIKTLRIDRDTTTSKNSHETLFREFKSGKADVLIGTQMIVKGLHFPSVTLVGVLNSDAALNIPDFRSSENVFNLITQVSGRSGRSGLMGEVVIQTFMKNNPVILNASKQDFKTFYLEEIENRKLFNYPPFINIIKILFSGIDPSQTLNFAKDFRKKLIQQLPSDIQIYPIVPSGKPKIKDNFRFIFLLKTKNTSFLSAKIMSVKNTLKPPKDISMLIDVDPTNTFF